MSSAKNHAMRSRRGYRVQKSVTGGYRRSVWVKQNTEHWMLKKVRLFRRMWERLTRGRFEN